MKYLILGFVLFFSVVYYAWADTHQNKAILLNFKGPIGPASVDYFEAGLKQARQTQAPILIFQLNTPGGLMTSMRDLIEMMLSSPMPVIVYVAPNGARAASAGTYIVYAANIAAMAPGTHLGAATPVQFGGIMDKPPDNKPDNKNERSKPAEKTTMEKKALEDSLAYIRTLAQFRDRNVQWAEQAVLKGASLSAQEALRMKVIDVIAKDIPDLLTQIHHKQVKVNDRIQILETEHLLVDEFKMNWRTHFLNTITDPNIAYILLLVGIYGLFFEFANPGFVLPGIIGGISLLLGLYALSLLPVNYAGVGLMLIGIALIITEAFSTGFGLFGIGGAIAFVIGSIFLLDRNIPGFQVDLYLILSITLLTTLFLVLIIQFVIRSRLKPVVSGREYLVGKQAYVTRNFQGVLQILVEGETWPVESETEIKEGQRVEVIQVKGLKLLVKII